MNNKDLELLFYIKHSKFSDPKSYLSIFKKLPKSIEFFCTLIQELLIHETDAEIFNIVHPPKRFNEISIRTIYDMIKQLYKLEGDALISTRPPKKRLISSCRNFALLLLSLCRSLNIPSRMRVGFSNYTSKDPSFFIEHTLVEYWHAAEKRWILVDPRVSAYHFQIKRILTKFDFFDVPRSMFFTAGKIWQDARSGLIDPTRYGFGGSRKFNGLWYIRNRLMHDLAALNKFEMLPWDAWGYMLHEPISTEPINSKQLNHIDQLAKVISGFEIDFNITQQLWQNPNFKVPSIVITYDRYFGPNSVAI